jgi:phage gpG-like protein
MTLTLDVQPVLKRLYGMATRFENRTKLHERIVITLQGRVFRSWPTGPALSEFTMLTRRGQAVLQDTGYLRMSIVGRNPAQISTAEETLNRTEQALSVLGSAVKYAALQNYGGTVRPVSASNLSLPATVEARRAGSPRNFPKDLHWLPVVHGDATSTGWLAEITGHGKNRIITRHYLLKSSVDIPARRFFPNDEEAAQDTIKVANYWLSELLEGRDI